LHLDEDLATISSEMTHICVYPSVGIVGRAGFTGFEALSGARVRSVSATGVLGNGSTAAFAWRCTS
jgi:hypothetical protein